MVIIPLETKHFTYTHTHSKHNNTNILLSVPIKNFFRSQIHIAQALGKRQLPPSYRRPDISPLLQVSYYALARPTQFCRKPST